MPSVTLSASPEENGFQATITCSNRVAISPAEAFPNESGAISTAALKLLEMRDRLKRSSKSDTYS